MITKLSLKVLINLGTILEKELLIKKCVKTLEDSKAHDLVNIDLNNNSSIFISHSEENKSTKVMLAHNF